jgi:hypothetical protein
MAVTTNGRRITRDDLQSAYSQLIGEGEATAQAAVPQILAVAGAVAVVALTLAYMAGKRRGRRRGALVVRRV